MPVVYDTTPQVPNSANEPLLGNIRKGGSGPRAGEYLQTGVPIKLPSNASVVTDENHANPHIVYDQAPYSERQPGILDKNLPTALQPYAGRIADIATGANDTLANAIGVPGAAVANVFRGLAGKPLMTSGDMADYIKTELTKIPGMGARAEQGFNQWYTNLGKQVGNQALLTMALVAGAGPMAAAGEGGSAAKIAGGISPELTGAGQVTDAIMKNIGEAAIRHPSVVAASDAASVLGQNVLPLADPYLKDLGLNTNPDMLALAGTLMGGPIGASLASMRRIRPTATPGKMAGLPKSAGLQINDAMPGATSLLPEAGFNAETIGKAVQNVKESVTSWMQNRFQRLTQNPNADPAVTSQRVRDVVQTAYQKARDIEGRMWSEVDMKRPVPVADIQTAARQVAMSAQDSSVRAADLPGDIIGDMLGWKKATLPMERLRDMARLARSQAATIANGDDRSLDVRGRNLTLLANSIDDSIAKAYPNDINLAKAKDYSRWLHDTFDKGPLGVFGDVRTQAAQQVDAQSALPAAMRDSRFGTNYAQMAKELGMTPEAQQAAQDWLRSKVLEAHQAVIQPGLNPEADALRASQAAENYMKTPDFQRFLKAFPPLSAVMNKQLTQLQGAVMKSLEVQRSAFFNKAQEDPEQTVERLMASGTKNHDLGVIMKHIGSDPNAVEALQYGLIRKLGNDAKWDPEVLRARINSRDIRPALQKVMTADGFARLNRILDTGAAYKTGITEHGGGPISQLPMARAGKIIGSTITGWLGGKSIQVHSIGAKTGADIFEKWFGLIPPEVILQRAVTDPNWERFLMSRLPSNIDTMRQTNRLLGLMVGGAVAAQHRLMENEK